MPFCLTWCCQAPLVMPVLVSDLRMLEPFFVVPEFVSEFHFVIALGLFDLLVVDVLGSIPSGAEFTGQSIILFAKCVNWIFLQQEYSKCKNNKGV